MKHFKNISDMIAHVESEADRYANAAEIATRPARIAERDYQASVANTRGYAAALRETARMLRETYIGANLHSAKPLEECR